MKKFTHAELAAAQQRGDWALLWQQAMPLVKLVAGRMRRGGAMRSEDVDDDLVQQGMLIAGEATRSWRPLECAFSTHITNRVRGDLLNYATTRANGGIGSHMQKPVVLSLGDERPDAKGDMTTGEDGGDEGGDGGTFEAALTYAGVVMPGGQHDGDGYVPEGFGDPSEEADVGAEAKVRAVLQHLSERNQHMFCSIYGIGGGRPQSVAEYAAAHGIPLRTLERRLAETKLLLAVKLRNFRHS
jgi:hypothetical protein